MDFLNDKKVSIISLSFNIVLIILLIFGYYKYTNFECVCNNDLAFNIEDNNEEEIIKSFKVEIKGSVKKPAVYEVNDENNINDLISMAGGLKNDAYTNNLNLSRKLYSEEVIYIFSKNEYKKFTDGISKTINEVINEEVIVKDNEEVKVTSKETDNIIIYEKPMEVICKCPDIDISKCTQNGASEIVIDKPKEEDTNENVKIIESEKLPEVYISEEEDNDLSNEDKQEKDNKGLVNINTASKDEFMTLDGIGEAKANKIIEYRETNGLFESIEDIKNVSGIGDKMYEAIKEHITV